MKKLIVVLCAVVFYGCSHQTAKNNDLASESVIVDSTSECVGTTELAEKYKGKLIAAEDSQLLASSLGNPQEGKLCQGQVYLSKAPIILYRAWNSTNPGSQFGRWWAFEKPNGKVAKYRADYEICYQWSPLDKMSRCTLQAGIKVVIGNGQSAKCSQYLTYPVSKAQQIYIESANEAMVNCETYNDEFNWQ
ncbi:hypothetical protein [Agarilytica rhodophyticola]|uniref:hypothetical protein n=1 Tax=Agarilytica rhodophyticola TaxID=1737490 RepID=UPI000B341502|nr:hypothetical protein [Agarilytica rhodophyticola]